MFCVRYTREFTLINKEPADTVSDTILQMTVALVTMMIDTFQHEQEKAQEQRYDQKQDVMKIISAEWLVVTQPINLRDIFNLLLLC